MHYSEVLFGHVGEKMSIKVGSVLCSNCSAMCDLLQCLYGCGWDEFCKRFDKTSIVTKLTGIIIAFSCDWHHRAHRFDLYLEI